MTNITHRYHTPEYLDAMVRMNPDSVSRETLIDLIQQMKADHALNMQEVEAHAEQLVKENDELDDQVTALQKEKDRLLLEHEDKLARADNRIDELERECSDLKEEIACLEANQA